MRATFYVLLFVFSGVFYQGCRDDQVLDRKPPPFGVVSERVALALTDKGVTPQGRVDMSEVEAAARNLLDSLIPIAGRRDMMLRQEVTDSVNVTTWKYSERDKLLTIGAGSGQSPQERVELQVASGHMIKLRASGATWGRDGSGIKVEEIARRKRRVGRTAGILIVSYDQLDVEAWIVGEKFLLLIVPDKLGNREARERFVAGLERVADRCETYSARFDDLERAVLEL
jgi:hypothetical protein